MGRTRSVLVGWAVLVAATASACGTASGPVSTSSSSTSELGWVTLESPVEVSAFDGPALDGHDAQGDEEFTLVNLWASTCTPCRTEIPVLNRVDTDPRVEVVGLSMDAFEKYARQFEREVDAEFPSWLDIEQEWTERLTGATRLRALPTSYVLRDGRIVAVHTGDFEKPEDALTVLDRL